MTRNVNEYLPAILNVLAAAVVMIVSFAVDLHFPVSRETARILGVSLVAGGMGVVVWAAAHIKGAFLGEVAPRLPNLVQTGPYRFVRHPVYLGMTVALAGVAVTVRSWPGLVAVFLLFLPSEIYRARQEEKVLNDMFGKMWRDYARRTGFLVPRIGSE